MTDTEASSSPTASDWNTTVLELRERFSGQKDSVLFCLHKLEQDAVLLARVTGSEGVELLGPGLVGGRGGLGGFGHFRWWGWGLRGQGPTAGRRRFGRTA